MNGVTYTYCINHQLSWGHNQAPKVASKTQRISYSSSFIPRKNQRELLLSAVVFAVNRYECFMENENMIRTFCGYKPSKSNIELHQKFIVSYKKHGGSQLTPRYTEYQTIKKVNRIKRINTMLNLKTRFIWEKIKHGIINEMSWCNVLRRTSSDYCVEW